MTSIRRGWMALATGACVAALSVMLTLGPPSQNPDAVAFFHTHGFPVDKYPIEGMRPVWMGTDQYNPLPVPDKYLSDGDIIPVGDRKLEVIWTPGHAPGHCVIYLREEQVLIVGDHLLPKITPHVGLYPDATGDPLGHCAVPQRRQFGRGASVRR